MIDEISAEKLAALASTIDAAAQYYTASGGDDILSHDTRVKIDRVVARFCKQALGETDE